MLPGTMLGSLVGVQLNSIMPDAAILICLTIVLIYIGWKTLTKGLSEYKEENLERQRAL